MMSSPATSIYIALGGNVGDVRQTFRWVIERDFPSWGIDVLRCSSAYRTRAMTLEPEETQPDYWNAVVEARSALEPAALLASLHEIEALHGRERIRQWAPRTLDLDLLLYGVRVCAEDPELPHPRLQSRAFVLVPLVELAPELALPCGLLVREALDRLGRAAEGEILEQDASLAQCR